jgi:4-hydroxy-3-polyprenylbenzoate decarboxylase
MPTYYRSLGAFLQHLDEQGMLVRYPAPIDKDTQLQPLVRLQFRGLPEAERKAFLFDQVVNTAGQRYGMPVAAACMAASRRMYALGLGCAPDGIGARWAAALARPLPPTLVDGGPIHDVVYTGDELARAGGLDLLPVPLATPGFDNAPYLSASYWITKDPDSGVRNVGTYRGQLKAPLRVGCYPASRQKGIAIHWEKARARGEPLEAAVVVGAPPHIAYPAVAFLPRDVDELAVAGGLAGEPVPLVRCRTVDLEVPAEAEIVIEGRIPTDVLEEEGPFGEFTGYMARREYTHFLEVTAITHRRDAVFQVFLSQFPPSESSKIRQIAMENTLRRHLTTDCGLAGIRAVAVHESASSQNLIVIQVCRAEGADPRAILAAAARPDARTGKILVVVDEDIDPTDADSVNWALAWRMQPHRDVEIRPVPPHEMDYSVLPPATAVGTATGHQASVLLIDATQKWAYPPASLPERRFMEEARGLWEATGLPPLRLQEPWYGLSEGVWTDADRAEAARALRGDYHTTGTRMARERIPPPEA